MPKKATKASDNEFYKARIAAASCNERLSSREGAAEETSIDRTRLARIELGSLNPYPEEVLLMSDTYNAPEIENYYCTHLCPLGKRTVTPGRNARHRQADDQSYNRPRRCQPHQGCNPASSKGRRSFTGRK